MALANAYFKLAGTRVRSLPFFPNATMGGLRPAWGPERAPHAPRRVVRGAPAKPGRPSK
jgi:hypothetical protein